MSELYTDKKRDLTKLKSKSRTFFPSRKMRASIGSSNSCTLNYKPMGQVTVNFHYKPVIKTILTLNITSNYRG